MKRIWLLIYFMSLATFVAAQPRETYADLAGARIWYRDTGGKVLVIDAVGEMNDVTQRALDALGAQGIRP